MKRSFVTTVAGCLVLGLVLAGMGCERDGRPDYGWATVDNYSSQTIGYLFISPASSPSWGVDQLGSSSISPGGSFTVTDIEVGYYDMMAEDLDQNVLADRYDQYIGEGGLTWALTD